MVEIEKPRIECIDSQEDVSYGKSVSYTHLTLPTIPYV